jgi:hypothetical protein
MQRGAEGRKTVLGGTSMPTVWNPPCYLYHIFCENSLGARRLGAGGISGEAGGVFCDVLMGRDEPARFGVGFEGFAAVPRGELTSALREAVLDVDNGARPEVVVGASES